MGDWGDVFQQRILGDALEVEECSVDQNGHGEVGSHLLHLGPV